MLEEAVEVMRLLWRGEVTTFEGKHFRVEDARVYTLPDDPLQVVVAAAAPEAAELAARIGDGIVSTAPDEELVDTFLRAGGGGPRYGQLTVCWARTEEEARRTAYELWPTAALEGPLSQELPLPSHFEEVAAMVSEDDVAERVVCGPDAARHLAGIQELADAGFDHVYVHQVGPDQDGFFDFYAREVLPETARIEPREGIAQRARA